MKIYIDKNELQERIDRNYNRLQSGDYYKIDNIFSPADYTWYGDKEGRALLSFVSHYKISGNVIPCMNELLENMPSHLNNDGYFGPIYDNVIQEQQLSGHSWLLRGLCEHYLAFHDDFSLTEIKLITENLYLKNIGKFVSYPINREEKNVGDVSGNDIGNKNGWILSSDIGCAFMSIDGLSHAYEILKNDRLKDLLDEMIDTYLAIDKVKLKAQTHCTLTSARGMVRMYNMTNDKKYLDGALKILDLYVSSGMTLTYQNLNWWGRPDTWTEPCAIVDSLMLSCELYKITKDEKYRKLAARIYHNGLSTSQRENGGAGTDTVVTEGVCDILKSKMYEAYFCCTMRLSEGLWYINENAELLYAETNGKVEKQGRMYKDGDIIYAEVTGDGEKYVKESLTLDGHKFSPILKYYNIPKEVIENTEQKILF